MYPPASMLHWMRLVPGMRGAEAPASRPRGDTRGPERDAATLRRRPLHLPYKDVDALRGFEICLEGEAPQGC